MTLLDAAQLVLVQAGEKGPRVKGWPDIHPSPDEVQRHLAAGGNLAFRVGRASGNWVDVDLDCSEAIALGDLYLLPTGAEFGRASKPRCHRLYIAPGSVYASFSDALTGEMLLELRADGRDGGAHCTLVPPSIADGEQREWHGETIEPATVKAGVLARRCAWLAIGVLTWRYLSEHAAWRPYHDLPDILWEADPKLGRHAYRWIGKLAPDERPPDLKPRRDMTGAEMRLEEIVAAIPNDCSWEEWNRVGMAIYASSGGSELGFVAFDYFSSRCPTKYDPYAVLGPRLITSSRG
jgi:hypothetical protein